ncbi:unnamed protein product [Caenorhabditis brenneri]
MFQFNKPVDIEKFEMKLAFIMLLIVPLGRPASILDITWRIPNCAKVPLQLPITISNTLLNHCSPPKDLLNVRFVTEISKLVSTETKQLLDGLRNAAFGQGGSIQQL